MCKSLRRTAFRLALISEQVVRYSITIFQVIKIYRFDQVAFSHLGSN